MQRLSSNATLFLKIFVPVFWTTIVIAVNILLWTAPEHYFGGIDLQSIRWAMLLVLVAGTATFLLLFWPLKRVEATNEHVYVSNYFKTARYRWNEDVLGLEQRRFLFLNIGTLYFEGRGTFGSSIRFVVSKRLLAIFNENNPELIKKVEDN